jgi:hypothetical protein
MRRRQPLSGWGLLLVLPVIILWFTPPTWPRWAVMWSLALGIFIGCKWLTWYRTEVDRAPWWLHAGYLVAWPGLDARAFLNPQSLEVERPTLREWIFAGVKLLAGVTLFWWVAGAIPEENRIVRGWIGMMGLILMLHFVCSMRKSWPAKAAWPVACAFTSQRSGEYASHCSSCLMFRNIS